MAAHTEYRDITQDGKASEVTPRNDDPVEALEVTPTNEDPVEALEVKEDTSNNEDPLEAKPEKLAEDCRPQAFASKEDDVGTVDLPKKKTWQVLVAVVDLLQSTRRYESARASIESGVTFGICVVFGLHGLTECIGARHDTTQDSLKDAIITER